MKRYHHNSRHILLGVALLFTAMMAQAQHLQIYNGLMERGYPKSLYVNTPYYPEQFQSGSVTFNGYAYHGVQLKCDLYKGQVIILSPATGRSLIYEPYDLERVVIGDAEYQYLEEPDNGWYEVIDSGDDWTLYRRHYISSTTHEVRQSSQLTRFYPRQRVYLSRQGEWYGIGNVNALCKPFKEHKAEIKAYAKQHGLKVDELDNAAWRRLTAYIKSL